jgi:ADP-heptose:LPS heptosyltransferase
LANTSCNQTACNETAAKLLGQCLRGQPWQRELLDELLRGGCDDALFRVVAEGLADRFEPALCRVYDEIFSQALGVPVPPRRPLEMRDFRKVFVLSRVTLGADVAVTSVILDAARQRFPDAAICFAGPGKNAELFSADPRVSHAEICYRRGALPDRTAHWAELRRVVDEPDALVIDPDSRLTQLGLLPVCREENYLFFESRGYAAESGESLPQLTARWCRETLGVPGKPYIAVTPARIERPAVTISLGIGDNPAKRLPDPFEADLLRLLAQTGAHLWIDAGAGGEEAGRVARAIAGIPPHQVHTWRGSFAGFAAIIQAGDLYVGYDSAGQHVAAACRIPQITVFAGEACERMFQRWRPTGHDKIRVLRTKDHDAAAILDVIACELGALPR